MRWDLEMRGIGRFRSVLFLGLIAWMAAVLAAGATEEPPAYSLGDCIRAALENSPDLAAARAEIAAARARLDQAKAGRFGQADYTQYLGIVNRARGTVNDDPPRDDREDFFNHPGPFTRIELNVNVPLWTFGKLDAALAAAEGGLARQLADGEKRRAEVAQNTRQLYYALLLSRQLSLVLRDMLETMDKAVAKTQARLDRGEKSVTDLDVLKLRIGRARFAKGVLEVETSAGLARNALARAVGLEPEAPFDIRDRKLEPLPADLAPLEHYLDRGLRDRPEWKELQSGLAAQTAKVEMEEAGYYPSFFLATGVHYAYAGNREEQKNPFANEEFNYLRPIGVVGLRWDLGFLATRAKVEEARAELEALKAREREARSGLLLEIRKAYSDVVQLGETIKTTEEGRKAARALLVLTVSNFDLGLGEAEALFEGLGAYTEASADHLRAVHDYNVALGALHKAVGDRAGEAP